MRGHRRLQENRPAAVLFGDVRSVEAAERAADTVVACAETVVNIVSIARSASTGRCGNSGQANSESTPRAFM
jgi:hypothetical protein